MSCQTLASSTSETAEHRSGEPWRQFLAAVARIDAEAVRTLTHYARGGGYFLGRLGNTTGQPTIAIDPSSAAISGLQR
jgi:hypothetical protein